jgi:hypothetical protein
MNEYKIKYKEIEVIGKGASGNLKVFELNRHGLFDSKKKYKGIFCFKSNGFAVFE